MKYIYSVTLFFSLLFINCSVDNKEKNNLLKSEIIFDSLKQSPDWILSRIEGQTIFFKNGNKLITDLYNLKFISHFHSNKTPFFIVSGRNCENCDENISIYIYIL